MNVHPIFKSAIILSALTLCVYLFLKFAFPVIFPFVIAYAIMYMLLPVVNFVSCKGHLPSWFAFGSTLTVFFSLISASVLFTGNFFLRQFHFFINNFSIYCSYINNFCLTVCGIVDKYFDINKGTSYNYLSKKIGILTDNYSNVLFKDVCHIFSCSVSCITYIFTVTVIIIISMILLCSDIEKIQNKIHSLSFSKNAAAILTTLKESTFSYIKIQLMIFIINCIICCISFFLSHNKYYLVIGFLTAFIDALPVLGSSIVLFPFGIYFIFTHQYLNASIMFTAYILTLLVREYMETKLMGAHTQILPFFMLMSIYIGIKLFGIFGLFLGPIGLLMIKTIYPYLNKYFN